MGHVSADVGAGREQITVLEPFPPQILLFLSSAVRSVSFRELWQEIRRQSVTEAEKWRHQWQANTGKSAALYSFSDRPPLPLLSPDRRSRVKPHDAHAGRTVDCSWSSSGKHWSEREDAGSVAKTGSMAKGGVVTE